MSAENEWLRRSCMKIANVAFSCMPRRQSRDFCMLSDAIAEYSAHDWLHKGNLYLAFMGMLLLPKKLT